MNPKVSINLCCYNSEKYLRETLDSIVNQTYKNWELIIINDGSSDSTEAIIYEYIKQGYPIIYHYQENKGLGYSRNEALKRSKGEYIAFIDHDDIWLPRKLEKQITLFGEKPGLGMVYCNSVFFNNDGTSYLLYGKKKPPEGRIFRELLKGNFLSLQTVLISRNSLNGLNEWFDERFYVAEDADLFIRIAHDFEVGYADEPLAKYRINMKSLTYSRKELVPKEIELMLQKFNSLYKNFGEQFKEEILFLKATIAYLYTLLEWEKGEKKSARTRLYPYLNRFKKLWIPYLFLFLPYNVYMQIKSLYKSSPLYKNIF
jgi:glycosyltransferase involved in cell wall biosynthesis